MSLGDDRKKEREREREGGRERGREREKEGKLDEWQPVLHTRLQWLSHEVTNPQLPYTEEAYVVNTWHPCSRNFSLSDVFWGLFKCCPLRRWGLLVPEPISTSQGRRGFREEAAGKQDKEKSFSSCPVKSALCPLLPYLGFFERIMDSTQVSQSFVFLPGALLIFLMAV